MKNAAIRCGGAHADRTNCCVHIGPNAFVGHGIGQSCEMIHQFCSVVIVSQVNARVKRAVDPSHLRHIIRLEREEEAEAERKQKKKQKRKQKKTGKKESGTAHNDEKKREGSGSTASTSLSLSRISTSTQGMLTPIANHEERAARLHVASGAEYNEKKREGRGSSCSLLHHDEREARQQAVLPARRPVTDQVVKSEGIVDPEVCSRGPQCHPGGHLPQ